MYQWTLRTASSQYSVSLLADQSGLVLDHWGPVLGAVEPWSEPDRWVEYRFPADTQPLEYASAGQRHVEFSELLVRGIDGTDGVAWHCPDPESTEWVAFESSATTELLSIRFVDVAANAEGSLQLVLNIETSRSHDVVRKWVEIRNHSRQPVELTRALSAAWPLPVGRVGAVEYLAGAWSREYEAKVMKLDHGSFSFGSRSGVTGHSFSPVVTVPSGIPERAGEAYGISLDWTGSWQFVIDSTAVGDRLRVSCGLHPDVTAVFLEPGQTFTAPASLGAWSAGGSAGVSQAWQRYQRSILARSAAIENHPIVYNSWYATYFDVRAEHQLELADRAAAIGAEVFVIDDGWFTGRAEANGGLGDWVTDSEKMPNGLADLADEVIARGLRFGLWVEPEAVSPTSRLFAEHPEWVYRSGQRPLMTKRDQYVLDFGREDVVDWAITTFRDLIASARISYLKWDMNRPVSDGGRPGDPHGREWSIQHTHGVYRVLDMIREEFPHITVEGCAAGGARVDNAILARTDVVWASDETGPLDRLHINHGYLSAYPQHALLTLVTGERGARWRPDVSDEYRYLVAMMGVLGIGTDLLNQDSESIRVATRMIELYRTTREITLFGDVRRHGTPAENSYAVEYAAPSDGRGCMFVFDSDRDRITDRERVRVRPQLLDPNQLYALRGTDLRFTGESARVLGVPVPFSLAKDADVLIFEPVSP